MTVTQILDRIWLMNGRHICITGGEPLLWAEEVLELLKKFKIHGYTAEIETNGTIDFRDMQPYASICMDVKCPSSGEESDLALLNHITKHDCVKFVVADEIDLFYAQAVMANCKIEGEIIISPVEGTDYRAVADYIVEENLPVRFQIQLHKVLGMR